MIVQFAKLAIGLKNNGSKIGIVAVVIVVAVVFFAQRNTIGKLRNQIGALKPYTVQVVASAVHDTVVKVLSVTVPHEVMSEVIHVIGDTVFKIIEKVRTDTVKIEHRGVIDFEDASNRLVRVKGSVDYPLGQRIKLVYTEKEFWDLQRNWGVFVDGGVMEGVSPFLGVSGFYRKVGAQFGVAKNDWFIGLKLRLL